MALCVWLGAITTQVVSLRARAERLQTLAANPKQMQLAQVTQDIHGARGEVTALRFELAPVLWLAAWLNPDANAIKALADAGTEALSAADETLTALDPALGDFSTASLSLASLPRVLDALANAQPALLGANARLDRAHDAVAQIDRTALSPRVAGWVAQADQYVELARQALGAAQIAPTMLGQTGARTYIVLVQNSDELRPTGGFISSYGRVVIEHGQVITQTFQDSYTVDNFARDYPDPPKPLFDYMASEQWVFRDANWSPDFPTTARDAMRLYQIGKPEQVDGVIALNLKAVLMLMPALEPLTVDHIAEPVTRANAAQLFQEAWNPALGATTPQDNVAWIYARKQFVGAAARAAMSRLQTGKVNWVALGRGALDALRQRQIAVYAPDAQAGLQRIGWDGAVRNVPGDYLMIVDANIGFAKVNPLVDERADYAVTLDAHGAARARVTLNYTHRGTQPGIACTMYVAYDLNITYDKMMNRCYYDYVRVLAPQGSQLITATAHLTPGKYLVRNKTADGRAETLAAEAGRAAFGQFFVVEYGKTLQTQFEYTVPTVVTTNQGQARYMLTLQKQPGTDALPVHVTVTLPSGARFISAMPIPATQANGVAQFDLVLDTDQQIQMIYAPGN